MPKPNGDHYLKLYIGEAVIVAARAQSDNDALRQRVAELEAQLAQLAKIAEPPRAPEPPS